MEWIAFREPIGDGCGKQQQEATNEGFQHRTRVQCPKCEQNYSLWLTTGEDSRPAEDMLKKHLIRNCASHVDVVRSGEPLFPEN